jgi:hypothetical protein
MASIYDVFADSCNAIAAKTKNKSDSLRLLQLANRWRTVPADRVGAGRKPPAPVALTNEILKGVHRRPGPTALIKSAKAEAIDKATEAIAVLRELGLDNDTILSDLSLLDAIPRKRR